MTYDWLTQYLLRGRIERAMQSDQVLLKRDPR